MSARVLMSKSAAWALMGVKHTVSAETVAVMNARLRKATNLKQMVMLITFSFLKIV